VIRDRNVTGVQTVLFRSLIFCLTDGVCIFFCCQEWMPLHFEYLLISTFLSIRIYIALIDKPHSILSLKAENFSFRGVMFPVSRYAKLNIINRQANRKGGVIGTDYRSQEPGKVL